MANVKDVMAAVKWGRRAAEYYGIEGLNETQTRYSLIDPVLDSLGWDIRDPMVVRVEVGVDAKIGKFKRADYVLFDGES